MGKHSIAMRTLYGKFLLVFLPLTTLTFIIFSIISAYQMYEEGLDKLQSKMEHMHQSQSMIMAEKVWLKDVEKVHLNAASIIADPDVIGIKISGMEDDTLGSYAWNDVTDQHLIMAGKINYVVDYKVEKVGYLKIAYTNENVLQDTQNITFDRILFFAGFLIFTLLASFLAYQLTVRKVLARLSKAFESSGAGNSEEIEWISSDDDIGSMVNSFNHMQQRTQQYANQIIKQQDQLELLVDERTSELQSEITLHQLT